MNVVKNTETIAMFIGSMGAGKSREVLRLLENEYLHYFEMVVFVCPTITINSTYIECEFLWKDPKIYTIKPEDNLIKWVNAISQKAIGRKTLFILDDCIGKEDLDKTRGELCELAIEIRHRKHNLWFLTQTYVGIPKKFRRLVNMTFLWFLKDKNDQKQIADENAFIDDWPEIFKKLRDSDSKHCFAYIRGEKLFSVQIKDGKTSDNKRGKKRWEKQLEKIKAKHLEEIKSRGNDTGDDTGSTGNDMGDDTGSTGNDTSKDTILSQVNRYYYGGAGIALVAGIALLYFYQKPEKTPAPVPTRPKVSDDDFFRMN